ncbi:MAG: C69 family dipeptidase [Bacteroidales bacterium]|nr:C69 family dipeptidase [Bacteroidales bacterium]
MRIKTTLLILLLALTVWQGNACTNILVTRGATADGSTMITYAADSHTRYGQLRFHPGGTHLPGEMLSLYNYGSLKHQIDIPQAARTYRVVGFINEHQFAMGETTWGGIAPLSKGNAEGIDYGNLIYLALQRARNCREAIRIMADLVATYGYADGGETFSLCDPDEVWLFEITSKGQEKGAVWVARRVPEGHVSAHANQARITTFPQEPSRWRKRGPHPAISSLHLDYINNPEVECVYSHDVISFAQKNGFAAYTGKPKHTDADFSFADTYNPLTFSGLRACEARVYAVFNRIAPGMERYEAYAMGDPTAERLPLWVKPATKLYTREVMELMRDHFEGTPMDMTQDVGAGPFHCPYRWRPMDFKVDGKEYIHERAISTQQTGFSFVAQCRKGLPDYLGGIIWFGVDDTYSTCYCPMFCAIDSIPLCFREGNGSMSQYSPTAAFWLFNRVSNFCYLRYDSMIVDVRTCQHNLEELFVDRVYRLDSTATPQQLTALSHQLASTMMQVWTKLDQLLLMRYIDGNIKRVKEGQIETTPTGVVRFPQQPPYPDWFYRAIVNDHGDVLRVR